MRRRNFVTALAGLAALPFVGKGTEKSVEPKPQSVKVTNDGGNCTCVLTHREFYSGNRCTDARIISGCIKHGERGLIGAGGVN